MLAHYRPPLDHQSAVLKQRADSGVHIALVIGDTSSCIAAAEVKDANNNGTNAALDDGAAARIKREA